MAIKQDQTLEEQLFTAIEDHNSGLLAALILADASLDATNEYGKTPLQVAFESRCPDELRLMIGEVRRFCSVNSQIVEFGFAAIVFAK